MPESVRLQVDIPIVQAQRLIDALCVHGNYEMNAGEGETRIAFARAEHQRILKHLLVEHERSGAAMHAGGQAAQAVDDEVDLS